MTTVNAEKRRELHGTVAALLDELVAQVEREPELNSIAALQARAFILTGRHDDLAALLLRLAGTDTHKAQMEADEVLKVLDGYRKTPLTDKQVRWFWWYLRMWLREPKRNAVGIDYEVDLLIGDAFEVAEVAS
jgi:hypothetical protein